MEESAVMADVDENELKLFRNFVHSRYELFVRRQSGLPHQLWTDDPILSSGRSFTNVFRVLDRGTQRLVRMLWSDRGQNMDPQSTLMLCMVYRRTNNTDFWERVPDETMVPNMGDLPEWFSRLEAVADQYGLNPIDQHPYLLAGSLNPRGRGLSLWQVLSLNAREWVCGDIQLGNGTNIGSLTGHFDWQHIMDNLRAQTGISDFLAQQITTDFGYSRHGNEYFDDDDVVLGPGSARGLHLIFPDLDLRKGLIVKGAIIILRDEIREQRTEVDLQGAGLGHHHRPSLMDIQNCLCEFDKYRRISMGGTYNRRWHSHGQKDITFPGNWNGLPIGV